MSETEHWGNKSSDGMAPLRSTVRRELPDTSQDRSARHEATGTGQQQTDKSWQGQKTEFLLNDAIKSGSELNP